MPLPSMTQGVLGKYAPVRQGMALSQLALGDPSMAPPNPNQPVMSALPPMAPRPVAPAPPAPGVALPAQASGTPLSQMRQRFQPLSQGSA